jgi:plastocyanin
MYVNPIFDFDADPFWFSLGNPIDVVVDPNATPEPTKEPAPTPTTVPATATTGDAGTGNTRNSPIPLNTTGQIADYEITVVSVTPNANDVVMAENQFNAAPAPDKQFFMARVTATYVGSATGTPWLDLNFQAVGVGNTGYSTFNDTCGVIPDDPINTSELFPGGSAEFNICWEIAATDQGTLVMYVEPSMSFNEDPTWFSLGNSTVVTVVPTEAVTPTESTGSSAVALNLSAMDIAYDQTEIRIPANTDVTLTIVNDGMLQHNFVIDNPAISTEELNGGESASITLNLPPGTYTFHCTVPGHTEAGQTGTLIVG